MIALHANTSTFQQSNIHTNALNRTKTHKRRSAQSNERARVEEKKPVSALIALNYLIVCTFDRDLNLIRINTNQPTD